MQYVHYSVMQNEVLDFLNPGDKQATLVDCTLGEGGHSNLFLGRYPNLKVVGLDRDPKILEKAKTRLSVYGDRFQSVNTRFDEFWTNYQGPQVDYVLFDLGISVFHYEESGRGFSFKRSEKLDMRLDPSCDMDAADIVNTYDQESLANVIYEYGEERYSRRIASAICEYRQTKQIEMTDELADIVWNAVPNEYRHRRIHPATKTFQALRIEVNGELDRIKPALEGAMKALKSGGRIAVITFHSLEDRPVKWFFKENTNWLDILTKKPLEPTEDECSINPPSRSAKLRVVEKLSEERKYTGKVNKYKEMKEMENEEF